MRLGVGNSECGVRNAELFESGRWERLLAAIRICFELSIAAKSRSHNSIIQYVLFFQVFACPC
jgi:hypothetical protein